jgi:excisionase family DNA binding protein
MERLTVDVKTAAEMTSLSTVFLRRRIRDGALDATRCGRRVLVSVKSLKRLVKNGTARRTKSNDTRIR